MWISGIFFGGFPYNHHHLGLRLDGEKVAMQFAQESLFGGWTTHLKNMRKSNWIIFPGIGAENSKNVWSFTT